MNGTAYLGFGVYFANGDFVTGTSGFSQDGGYSANDGSGNGSDSAIFGENDFGSFISSLFGGGDEFTSASAVSANVSGIAQYVVANGDTNATQAAQAAELEAYGAATYSTLGTSTPASYAFEGVKSASKTITWSFANSAGTAASPFSSYITNSTYKTLVTNAFAAWATAGGFTFTQVADSASADIRVGFGTFSTATSGISGYTAYQQNSSLQIQPDVILRLEDPSQLGLVSGTGGALKYSGTNTYTYETILHEIGHALGLASDADSNSIMYYYGNGNTGTLDSNDTSGIQALYSTGGHAQVQPNQGASLASMQQQMVQANAAFLGESAATFTFTPQMAEPPPRSSTGALTWCGCRCHRIFPRCVTSPASPAACGAGGRKKIVDDAAGAGFDFNGDGHAGLKVDKTVVHLHLCVFKRHPRGIDKLLAFGLAAVAFIAHAGADLQRIFLRFLAQDGVLRDGLDMAMDEAIAGEVERIDLDLRRPAPACTKPISLLETIASISRWLSAGTIDISACAGVTTPPSV